MEKLIVLLAALALVVLGARGTYKAVWNSFFPNEQIVTTPTSTVGVGNSLTTVPGSNVPKGASQQQNQSPSGYATNPQEVGQQAGKATQNWINGLLSGAATGGTNTAHVVPAQGGVYKPTIVTTGGWQGQTPSGQQTGASYNQSYASNKPSWWPSWLPWPGDIGISLAR